MLKPRAWMQLKVVKQLTGLAMRQRILAGEQSNTLAGAHELHVLLHDQQAVDIAEYRMTRGAYCAKLRNNLGDELAGFYGIAGTLLIGDETSGRCRHMRHAFEREYHHVLLVERVKTVVVRCARAVGIELHEAAQSEVMQDAPGVGMRKFVRDVSLSAKFDRGAKRGVCFIDYARLLQHRPALRDGFIERRSACAFLKEHRLDLHAASQCNRLRALAPTAVQMQYAVRVAMQVQHDVVLQRFSQKRRFHGGNGIERR